jgi:galactokinase
VDLDREPAPARDGWGDYVRAAIAALASKRRLERGLIAVVRGELAGAGLSSSAAVLIGYLVGLAEANGIELSNRELAELVQLAENTFIGVSSGLLDQSVMIHAECGALTRIDCRDHTIEQIESPPGTTMPVILVAFTGAARSLVDSGYNLRVTECRDAARLLLELDGGKAPSQPRLRDVEPDIFADQGHRLPLRLRRRATHYFSEMERVARGTEAWRQGDLAGFGELVTASGESSIVNYECGTPPLTTLFELLRRESGVLGTRFSGGGFGGTCIALVVPDACHRIMTSVSAKFAESYPSLAPSALFEMCSPAGPMQIFRSNQ